MTAAVALAIAGFATVACAEESSETLIQKLAGVWEVEEGVNRGEEIPEDELEGTTMLVEENTIITYDPDRKEIYRATFTLDTSTDPISIDMTTKMKSLPQTRALGILKFEEDDEFELCYALPGSDRPKNFESPKGSEIMLFEVEKEE